MAVPKSYVFGKGRPTIPNEGVSSVLQYVPRSRLAWQPSQFSRFNMMPEDLKNFWDRGRGRTTPAFPNSGYFPQNTSSLEDNVQNIIPKHELEKFMPDIALGPKALVTPVSLMSARAGHRVTHDMLHPYDRFNNSTTIGQPAEVDHDNITPQDPNRVGLHPASIHCRGRVYRWLRRAPFSQEDAYFRAHVANPFSASVSTTPPEDAKLFRRILRLTKQGNLKAACEAYRSITSTPPATVYRALTAACARQSKLGDAIAVFEDGNSKLFYTARDAEVLLNVLNCAVRVRNRARVIWIYNIARGTFLENKLVRAEIQPSDMHRITVTALRACCDNEWIEEARVLFAFLCGGTDAEGRALPTDNYNVSTSQNTVTPMNAINTVSGAPQHDTPLCDYDLYERVGKQMREALAAGHAITSFNYSTMVPTLAPVKDADAIAPELVTALAGPAAAAQYDTPDLAYGYLGQRFPDVNIKAVLRYARLGHRKNQSVPKNERGKRYVERVLTWLSVLSGDEPSTSSQGLPALPYLRKSCPSSSNVRVVYLPENGGRPLTLDATAAQRRHTFFFSDFAQLGGSTHSNTRFVKETFPQPGLSPASRFLAQRPLHEPVSGEAYFNIPQPTGTASPSTLSTSSLLFAEPPSTAATGYLEQGPDHTIVLHRSLSGSTPGRPSSGVPQPSSNGRGIGIERRTAPDPAQPQF